MAEAPVVPYSRKSGGSLIDLILSLTEQSFER
jgi:hypothetical protein